MTHNCPPYSESTEKLYIWFTKIITCWRPTTPVFYEKLLGEKKSDIHYCDWVG